MSYSSKSEFEFEATGANVELDEHTGKVKRVVLETSTVETGEITFKPRYKKTVTTEEDGIEAEKDVEKMYELGDLPENISTVLRQAQEEDQVTCIATVTKYKADSEDESDTYFIGKDNGDTLKTRIIQDNGKREDES